MAATNIVLGTRNKKKRLELEDLLQLPQIHLQTLDEFPDAPEVEETGTTFVENATLKAVTLAKFFGAWVLGEDSGLSVDALDGAPGVYSARYAGEPCDDERNNDKLLEELKSVPEEKRTAYYTCCAVLADPEGIVRATADGRCYGRILFERRGTGGFGYDPMFLIPDQDKTFGELLLAFKQTRSHRAQAIAKLRPQLIELFGR